MRHSLPFLALLVGCTPGPLGLSTDQAPLLTPAGVVIGTGDRDHRDAAWGDVDCDGDLDLALARYRTRPPTEAELIDEVPGHDAAVVQLTDPMTPAVFAASPGLRLVAPT